MSEALVSRGEKGEMAMGLRLRTGRQEQRAACSRSPEAGQQAG